MRKNLYIIIGLFLVFAFSACEDLEVDYVNQPNFDKTNEPSQVNGKVGTLFNGWFMAGHYNTGVDERTNPLLALWTMADVGTCSWGNFGMRDLSSEPRGAFNNTPAYPNMVPFERYYKNMYSTLSSANDVLLAIQSDANNVVEEPLRAKAGAKFAQAACLGSIGLLYDKGFVVTEYTNIEEEVPMVSYDVIIDSALNMMDEAIALCENNTFTLPESWFPSPIAFTNVELGQLANTVAARLLAYKSRNATQNASNNWAKVKGYAENGITYDFEVIMDDDGWRDYMKAYGVFSGWGRVDMRVINMMDPNMPPWFPASGDIADLPNDGVATTDDKRIDTDFEYLSSQGFRAERGIYHFSTYRYSRLDGYLATWTGAVPAIRKVENDMLLAEALVRTGDLAGAAAILNDPANTRKARGGLADIEVEEQKLLDAIFYEKQIECILTGECVEFYDMRRNDLLQAGTFLHLPIPAQQLEVMQIDFYTFGGNLGVAGEDYSTGGWETKTSFQRPAY